MGASIIDILPAEILSLIFLHCVQQKPKYVSSGYVVETFPTFWDGDAPLLLLRVCREWRDISVSTPSLWNFLSFDCPYFKPNATTLARMVPQLESWLLRAGSLPLSLKIRYSFMHQPRLPSASSDGILQLLKRFATQLRQLYLDIPPPDFYRFREVVGPLPNLHTLTVFDALQHSMLPGAQPVAAFSDAATLRYVHIMDGFNAHSMPLPWGQLTTFVAGGMQMWHCLQVLSLAPNLVTYAANCLPNNPPHDRPIPVRPLLQLRKLVLNTMGVGLVPASIFLARLTTPALVHLEVDQLRSVGSWTAFLTRSDCILDHLTIEPTGWTSSEYHQYLSLGRLASLTELHLRRPGLAFYAILAPLKDSLEFLPRLKSLGEDAFLFSGGSRSLADEASLGDVVEMLEARRLEKFTLRYTTGLVGSRELLKRVQALQRDGMDIYITAEDWGA